MSFWDALLGRTRPVKPRIDPLFALSTAGVTFQTELGWVPAGQAGVVLRPTASQDFQQAKTEMDALVKLAAQEMGSEVETLKDKFGYRWLLLKDPDWEDLVALVHMAGSTLHEQGYGEQLLAAVFRLEPREDRPGPLYIIYTYKRGAFYPFFPRTNQQQERDYGEEMRVYSLLEQELPWEKDLSRWYPLWGCLV